MPVHEIRYKTWEGDLTATPWRVLSIPRFTLIAVFNKWLAAAMFGAGIVQFLGYTGYLIVNTNPLIQELTNITALPQVPPDRIVRNFYLVQFFICIGVMLICAPRLISPERQHNALPMIYSRPIRRAHYVLGKFLSVATLLSFLTVLQAGLLWLLMWSLYDRDHSFFDHFWDQSVPLFFGAMGVGVLMTSALGMLALACSTVRNGPYAATMMVAILAGSSFLTMMIQEVIWPGFPDLGLRDAFWTLGELWLNPYPDPDFSISKTLFILALWIGGTCWFMLWKLRPMEVYGE